MGDDDAKLRAAAELADAELARRHLGDFLGRMLPNYESAPHTVALVEHLEALERRDIRRLIVTMPPRHGKSMHCAAFVAWYLGRHPTENAIFASYGQELAEAHSRRARGLVTDERWPFAGVGVSSESSAVGRWHTTSGGQCIAAGTGGSLTGHGANVALVDDPVRSREDADSEAIREATWRWWTEVLLTRMAPNGVVVLVQTRWHEDDLAGRVLSSPGASEWTVLSLPALAEEDDPIGRAEGEALWPTWFGADILESLREDIGGRAFASLYQQRPTPDRGGTFQRAWMEGRYSKLPEGARVVQAVDSAFKTGVAHDWSVIATWATDGQWYYLVDVCRGRWEFHQLVRAIESEAAEHSPEAILIESAASGQSALQELHRSTGLPVVEAKVIGSKVSRAEAISPLFEAGKVLLPEQSPPWLADWIEEHVAFSSGRHDDQVDTTSLALDRLRDTGRAGGGVAGTVVVDWRQPRKPPTVEEELRECEAARARRAAAREARRKREAAAYRDPRFDAL